MASKFNKKGVKFHSNQPAKLSNNFNLQLNQIPNFNEPGRRSSDNKIPIPRHPNKNADFNVKNEIMKNFAAEIKKNENLSKVSFGFGDYIRIIFRDIFGSKHPSTSTNVNNFERRRIEYSVYFEYTNVINNLKLIDYYLDQ
jgi:hypothetical protein